MFERVIRGGRDMRYFWHICFVLISIICFKMFFEVQQARQGIGGEAILLFVPAVMALLKLRKDKKKG